jgi:hypothetical protein
MTLASAIRSGTAAAKIYFGLFPTECSPEVAVDLAFQSVAMLPVQVKSELLGLARLSMNDLRKRSWKSVR